VIPAHVFRSGTVRRQNVACNGTGRLKLPDDARLHALETGTWLGRSAIAIATALRDNGFGHLISLEADPDVARCAMAETGNAGLEDWLQVITDRSLNFQAQNELEFALFDSAIDIRAEEFRHFYEKLAPGATVVFHDTGAQHQGMAHAITELMEKGQLIGSFFPTPRGLFVGTVQRPAVLPKLTQDKGKPDSGRLRRLLRSAGGQPFSCSEFTVAALRVWRTCSTCSVPNCRPSC
jgi:hypothetical protein